MPSARFEIRFNEDDQARIERIRRMLLKIDPGRTGETVATIVRRSLHACEAELEAFLAESDRGRMQ